MNAFERLRQTIDKVSLTYQFHPDPTPNPTPTPTSETPLPKEAPPTEQTSSLHPQLQQLVNQTQASQLRQISQLSSKLEQLTKSLRRAESALSAQTEELVQLQRDNSQLKQQLSLQFGSAVQGEERDRKYKEEIHRIGVTVNELAIEINAERAARKQLQGELAAVQRAKVEGEEAERRRARQAEELLEGVKAELEQRVEMYEYNVKKAAEERKEAKAVLLRLQETHAAALEASRKETEQLRLQLSESKRENQVLALRKEAVEETAQRTARQLQTATTELSQKREECERLRRKLQETQRSEEGLQASVRSLGSELAEEKRNVKVKVVEVRDRTVELELEMYKRQCKELMQQQAIHDTLGLPGSSGYQVSSHLQELR